MSYFSVYPEYMFLLQEEVPIGSAKVRAVFSSGSGKVAGCMITTGKVVQDCNVRVLRKGKEVYVGSLDSLRRVKEAVKEVWNLHSESSNLHTAVHFLVNKLIKDAHLILY